MRIENLDMESITEARRKALAESIRMITFDQMKVLGERLFPFFEHPWRERYFEFLSENRGASFYHAKVEKEHIHILYCHEKNHGMWILPGSGMGPLQAKGIATMKAIVDAGH